LHSNDYLCALFTSTKRKETFFFCRTAVKWKFIAFQSQKAKTAVGNTVEEVKIKKASQTIVSHDDDRQNAICFRITNSNTFFCVVIDVSLPQGFSRLPLGWMNFCRHTRRKVTKNWLRDIACKSSIYPIFPVKCV
jgi:hypothetical protein